MTRRRLDCNPRRMTRGRPEGASAPIDETGAMRREEVARRMGVTPATLSRWVAKGAFSAPDVRWPRQRWNQTTIAPFLIDDRPKPN